MKGLIARFGLQSIYIVEHAGLLGLFLGRCFFRMITPPVKFNRIIKQIYFVGSRSAIVIMLAGMFTGMVVALQFYNTLERFASLELLGTAVALSLIRELGPVITGLVVTGRVGSAICAEIGIMRVSEQIDALECMGIDPYRFLMTAKLWAGLVSVPLLTALFDVAGIIGGYIVAVDFLGVGSGTFSQGLYNGIEWSDVEMGLVKSFAFGLLIIWICSAKGFWLHRQRIAVFGPEGVSQVTTDSVVFCSISILLVDYLLGTIML